MSVKCDKCPARIIWALTKNDKRMPLDADMVVGGNIALYPIEGSNDLRGLYVKPDPNVKRYVSHFATCPEAPQFRRRPAAGPDARSPAKTGATSPGTRAATPRPAATEARDASAEPASRPASAPAPVPPAAGPSSHETWTPEPGGPMHTLTVPVPALEPRPNSREDIASDGFARPQGGTHPPTVAQTARPNLSRVFAIPASLKDPETAAEVERERRQREATDNAGHARYQLERAWVFRRRQAEELEADRIPGPWADMADLVARLASHYAELAEAAVPRCQDTEDAHQAAREALDVAAELRRKQNAAPTLIHSTHKEI